MWGGRTTNHEHEPVIMIRRRVLTKAGLCLNKATKTSLALTWHFSLISATRAGIGGRSQINQLNEPPSKIRRVLSVAGVLSQVPH